MVQLGQASSESTHNPKPSSAAVVSERTVAAQSLPTTALTTGLELDELALAPPAPAVQGPALDTPREIIDMLDLRKRDLDRREQAIRRNEERLLIVRGEIEQLLARNEALDKRIQSARAKQEQQAGEGQAEQAKAMLERERQAQEQKLKLAKIYESMPPEEAAARLERMPERKAAEILRLIKGKIAGSILAQVKVERAAKLTEQLLGSNQ
jgi:flagellar motility protein MotE (MotC chaperone)